MNEIIIKSVWTKDLNDMDYDSFKNVQRMVFGIPDNYDEKFKKKYFGNPYGDSLFLFAYNKEQCVGTQVFWRNDVEENKAFQSCDSAILSEFQGHGIFSRLVVEGTKELSDALIYGFPNSKSVGAFKKLGWTICPVKKTKLYIPPDKSSVEFLRDEYLEWICSEPQGFCYKKIGDDYFILRRIKYNFYQIFGKIRNNHAVVLKKAHIPVKFIHSYDGKIGIGSTLIYLNNDSKIQIPDYKMDVWLYG